MLPQKSDFIIDAVYNHRVKDIIANTPKKKIPSKLFNTFAEIFFSGTPTHELKNHSDSNLLESLQQSFKFLDAPLKQSELKLAVFNPNFTRHSVIMTNLRDQPFLIDSLWLELNRRGIEVHHTFHPTLAVVRDSKGHVTELSRSDNKTTAIDQREAFIFIEFDRQSEEDIAEIHDAIANTLKIARQVVNDFPAITGKMDNVIQTLGHAKSHDMVEDTLENVAFLEWLLNDHFVFLGYRQYDLIHKKDKPFIKAKDGSSLGILKGAKESSVTEETPLENISPNLQRYMSSSKALTIAKSITKANIHRYVDMDYIGVKEFDDKGRVIREHRFLGLFTSRAYTDNIHNIPLIRQKINAIIASEPASKIGGYNHRALINILATYPRDELFQISMSDLHRITMGILHLKERQQTKLFVRHSADERLITAMVFLPRDQLTRVNRNRISAILCQSYNAEDITYNIHVSNSALARVFFMIRTEKNTSQTTSDDDTEKLIVELTRSWEDGLRRKMCELWGEHKGLNTFKKYNLSFQAGYQERTNTNIAIDDIQNIEGLIKSGKDNKLSISLHQTNDDGRASLRIYHKETPIHLSSIMPILEKMGLRVIEEHPSNVSTTDGVFWIHDFVVYPPEGASHSLIENSTTEQLTQAIELAWYGKITVDSLNKLITKGNLGAEAIIVLRSYIAYLQQVGSKYSAEYIRETLIKHSTITGRLWKLFDSRFNNDYDKKSAQKMEDSAIKSIYAGLKEVSVLDEDIIIRKLVGIIKATKRTNAFARTDITEPLAFKIFSADVPDLPKPAPLFEIFVYHVAVEGIHLRGGKVARGGLRWSDRPADFRTEILGLMKTQMTKNAVIVPVGSKGGFVLKKSPCDLKDLGTCDRDALKQAVVDAYKIFIRSLLSVTDNIKNDKVVPPKNVRRHDDDDPYFVVAADKGTATFSDLANSLSQESGFWLGDAFASGGSNGYDHKKMGITARGAWDSVKRHFREAGKDIQKEEFTCFAVGDMAGDVFGNGMLLSDKTLLVAAFNHMHIFIDPNPNSAESFKERKRLFVDVAGWDKYNTSKISAGGGVYSRNDKEITLSTQARKLLGLRKNKLPPNEVITAIMTMKAELFWNGGIGTFIKASDETHTEVSDRSNDEVRINSSQFNAKVIGEGGNLGMTQKARIDMAQRGVLLNTDAVDNSAGVDCSDHEVNIKILLDRAITDGKLSAQQRNKLLLDMTDDVANLVLQDNYLQTQLISFENQMRAFSAADAHLRMMRNFEKAGMLDRAIEYLPSDDEMDDRIKNGKGLTRPELSVLMAYGKMDLYNNLLKSSLPDEKCLEEYLIEYFPPQLRTKFAAEIKKHPLRREIIATSIANEVINRMGLSFIYRLRDETGYQDDVIARAFIITKRLYGLDDEWQRIEELDGKVPAFSQLKMLDSIRRLSEHVCLWFLRDGHASLDISDRYHVFNKIVNNLIKILPANMTEEMQKQHSYRAKLWQKDGLDHKTADHIALASALYAIQDIAQTIINTKQDEKTIMGLHFRIGEELSMEHLYQKARSMPNANYWQRVASQSIIDSLYSHQKQATLQAITLKNGKAAKSSAQDIIKTWADNKKETLTIYNRMVAELDSQTTVDHAMLNVALGHLKSITS